MKSNATEEEFELYEHFSNGYLRRGHGELTEALWEEELTFKNKKSNIKTTFGPSLVSGHPCFQQKIDPRSTVATKRNNIKATPKRNLHELAET